MGPSNRRPGPLPIPLQRHVQRYFVCCRHGHRRGDRQQHSLHPLVQHLVHRFRLLLVVPRFRMPRKCHHLLHHGGRDVLHYGDDFLWGQLDIIEGNWHSLPAFVFAACQLYQFESRMEHHLLDFHDSLDRLHFARKLNNRFIRGTVRVSLS